MSAGRFSSGPGANPMQMAMANVIAVGMERLTDLTLGFGTESAFNVDFFRDVQGVVTVVSTATQTVYGFVIKHDSLTDTHVHVIHVMTEGGMLDEKNYRVLTFRREADGSIRVVPGWV